MTSATARTGRRCSSSATSLQTRYGSASRAAQLEPEPRPVRSGVTPPTVAGARHRTAAARSGRGRGTIRGAGGGGRHSKRATWSAGAQWADSGTTLRLAQRRRREEARDAEAACRVGLQHVHGPGSSSRRKSSADPSRIRRPRRPSPAGAGRARGAGPSRSSELTGSSSQRTSRSASPRRRRARAARSNAPLASTNSSTSGPIASRATSSRCGSAVGVPADLHLDHPEAVGRPAGELVAQAPIVVRRETAAAVGRDALVRRAEQVDQRKPEQSCLQIPQRDVYRRDRRRGDARPAQVANGVDHPSPRSADIPGRGVLDRGHQDRGRQPTRAAVGVRIAQPDHALGACLHDHDRRGAPGERPIGLRRVRRNRAHRHIQALDARHPTWPFGGGSGRVSRRRDRRAVPLEGRLGHGCIVRPKPTDSRKPPTRSRCTGLSLAANQGSRPARREPPRRWASAHFLGGKDRPWATARSSQDASEASSATIAGGKT